MTGIQELRKAINKIEIVGVVKESKLNAGEGENGKYINGSLVIKAGEFTEVELKVYVGEKTQKGETRRAYSTLKQILDRKYLTLADHEDEEEAVKVRVWGNNDFSPQFREEMYVTDANPNEVVTRISIDLGFGNITINNDLTPEDYKAEFDVEMFVKSVEEEVKNGEATGRAIVHGYVPAYNGTVFPLQVVAGIIEDEEGEYDFGSEVLNHIQEGDTVRLWGDINYKRIITKKTVGGSLGRAKVEESVTYVNELNAVGGDIIDDPEKMFDEELIKIALKERESKKQETLEKYKEEKGNKGRGNINRGRGRVRPQRNKSVGDSEVEITEDMIPF